ncbi:XRE family transcriptional regulator [Streptomyces kaniharaensis]|uniref:XRE family transcriptional regulator n=1 Tax=Streptomyces kaniharaensis TaxID=212423 RepID=A0A6N7KZA7_9ACTN|nr:helix-turn-helix domain-containing protein [Streptomyces kaniharaensis]MQS16880.1 XRE family transcriptional regulator [Streptomyces kaniharaensis]
MTEQLGALLRRLRIEAGLTQEQVAERSGVSVRTIRRLERGGSTDHRLGTVNLLADALGASPEDRRRLAATLAKSQPVPESGPSEPSSAPAEPVAGPATEPADKPADAPPPIPAVLADAAAELATEVRRRWRCEEEQRRVHDPFPLPVRWQRAPEGLMDGPENVQRLAPGEAPGRLDLDGDLRSVADAYRRIPSGRLVVLGRAGSGKSILTIRFVLDFLQARAAPDRVPVIFSLGSWDPTTTALRDWQIDLLLRDHPHLVGRGPGGATLAAALIDADLVLPVLDGFDEIAEGLRQEALDALNATSQPLVLTSRRGEFAEAVEAARTPLVWAAGIELTDLTPDDLAAYLPRTARPVAHTAGGDAEPIWDPVLEQLRRRTEGSAHLARVLSTPLMVILARTMYSDAPDRKPAELLDAERFPTEHALEEHLLAGFVPALYRRRAPERDAAGPRRRWRHPDADRAERWLGHLADHLIRLDRHDLAWWQIGGSVRRPTRVLATVLASALCVAAAEWLVGLFLVVAYAGDPTVRGERYLLEGVLLGPIGGLAFGSVYGVMTVLGVLAPEPTHVRLRLPGTRHGGGPRPVRVFTGRFAIILLGGTVIGIGGATAQTLERAVYFGLPLTDGGVIEGTLINMLVYGLIFGAAAGLVFGLTGMLEVPLDTASAATPVALLSSNRAAVSRQVLVLVPAFTLAIALGGRLMVDLLRGPLGEMYWPLGDGFFIGAIGGIGGALSYALGFTAWGQWLILARVWLPLTGRLPWNVAAFLDDAYQRGVLRQTGAVYQFRHLRLQHHLGHAFRRRQADYRPATFPDRDPDRDEAPAGS